MSTYQNQNQFTQTPVLGQVDLTIAPAIISVKILPTSVAAVLQSGQGVVLSDTAGTEIIVDQATDATSQVFGVIVYNPRKNLYAAGDTVEIALRGTCVYMEASAAIARGARVQLDPTGPTVSTLVSYNTNCMVGTCLDKPTAAAQLCRILLDPRDPALSAY